MHGSRSLDNEVFPFDELGAWSKWVNPPKTGWPRRTSMIEEYDTPNLDPAVMAEREARDFRGAGLHFRKAIDAAKHPALLILDTHLLSNLLWSRTLFGDCPPWLETQLLARHYHLHLLLSPDDVEWTADGQRCQPELADRLVHRGDEIGKARVLPFIRDWADSVAHMGGAALFHASQQFQIGRAHV